MLTTLVLLSWLSLPLHLLLVSWLQFVNLLTTAQNAEVVLAAYPYMADAPASKYCGCAANG
jgi:hypothetical protein